MLISSDKPGNTCHDKLQVLLGTSLELGKHEDAATLLDPKGSQNIVLLSTADTFWKLLLAQMCTTKVEEVFGSLGALES